MAQPLEALIQVLETHFGRRQVRLATVGGSATWGMRWPEDLPGGEEMVLARFEGFETPFGPCGAVKLLSLEGEPVLRVPVHGYLAGDSGVVWGAQESLPTFWLLHRMGVEQALTDASVGGISAAPWDLVIVDDYFDVASNPVATLLARQIGVRHSRRALQPFCPRLRGFLLDSARAFQPQEHDLDQKLGAVHDGGVYVNTLPGPFETKAEIEFYRAQGWDVVGRSGGPEAMLARVAGMCFGGLYLVSNYAEGLKGDWGELSLDEFYAICAPPVGVVLLETLRRMLHAKRECICGQFAAEPGHRFPVPDA